MLIDARDIDAAEKAFESDIVIVGAGTIGLFLASRLVNLGHSILVIEAGGRVAEPAARVEDAGKPHNGANIGRAVGLGGTSTLWGGQLVEFDRRDLENPRAPWPLTYEELVRWYCATYDALGIPGRYSSEDYQKVFGIDVPAHSSIEQFFTSWLAQPNFAVLFKDSTVLNPKVKIVLNATVNRFIFENRRTVEVHAAGAGDRKLIFRGRNFVIAAGTLASSQIFLHAQRYEGTPWRDNERVGCYFHDHLGGPIAEMQVGDERRFRACFENGVRLGRKLQPKLRFKAEALPAEATGVCGFFAFNSSLSEQLANCKRLVRGFGSGLRLSSITSVVGDSFKLGRALVPVAVRFVRDRRILALFDRGVDFCVQAEQRPLRTSRISLLDDREPSNGLPAISLDWRVEGREIDSIRQFAKEADDFLKAAGLGNLRFDDGFWRDDVSIMSRLSDTYHQCGGLQMGATPKQGVVDPDCRVWGTDNVFVGGPATLPSSSYANTTLTALALSARLSAALSREMN